MGQSEAVKSPVAFQKTNKIKAFAHVSYGMALSLFDYYGCVCQLKVVSSKLLDLANRH